MFASSLGTQRFPGNDGSMVYLCSQHWPFTGAIRRWRTSKKSNQKSFKVSHVWVEMMNRLWGFLWSYFVKLPPGVFLPVFTSGEAIWSYRGRFHLFWRFNISLWMIHPTTNKQMDICKSKKTLSSTVFISLGLTDPVKTRWQRATKPEPQINTCKHVVRALMVTDVFIDEGRFQKHQQEHSSIHMYEWTNATGSFLMKT